MPGVAAGSAPGVKRVGGVDMPFFRRRPYNDKTPFLPAIATGDMSNDNARHFSRC